eukprot:COSAG01_NODE_1888_length_8979_cov_78.343806_13_plen_204_part_00
MIAAHAAHAGSSAPNPKQHAPMLVNDGLLALALRHVLEACRAGAGAGCSRRALFGVAALGEFVDELTALPAYCCHFMGQSAALSQLPGGAPLVPRIEVRMSCPRTTHYWRPFYFVVTVMNLCDIGSSHEISWRQAAWARAQQHTSRRRAAQAKLFEPDGSQHRSLPSLAQFMEGVSHNGCPAHRSVPRRLVLKPRNAGLLAVD